LHNNGTTPQIILPDRRLLPDLAPPAGVNIQITTAGIIVAVYVGDQSQSVTVDPGAATQLGVNLISAGAMLQQAIQNAKKPAAGPQLVLPDSATETPDAAA
jgi:hypothetical protein